MAKILFSKFTEHLQFEEKKNYVESSNNAGLHVDDPCDILVVNLFTESLIVWSACDGEGRLSHFHLTWKLFSYLDYIASTYLRNKTYTMHMQAEAIDKMRSADVTVLDLRTHPNGCNIYMDLHYAYVSGH